MKKYILSLCALLPSTTTPMNKFKKISPGVNTQQLITLAVIDKIPKTIINTYTEYIINPFDIVSVKPLATLPPERRRSWRGRCYTRQDESYRIELKNGYVAICEYKQTGAESGEIDCCLEIEKTMIPLPLKNFFVAKEYYEATKLSYFKLH